MPAMRRLVPFVLALAATAATAAPSKDDVLQQAVNYVFTGQVNPQVPPRIVDRQKCVVVVPDRKYNRFARYYLNRFNMHEAMYTKRYSGSQVSYELDIEGNAVILEYLAADRTTVTEAFKSAQISLPGDIDRTKKALQYILSSG